MKHKKSMYVLILTVVLMFLLSSCNTKVSKEPITLTMWHVFGSQSASPMNEMVEKFNATVGKENGVTINVTSISNSSDIHKSLISAAKKEVGAGELPDLFFCYPEVAKTIGLDNFIDWNKVFNQKEMGEFVASFIEEGTIDGKVVILPVSKSSEALFINATIFDKFAAATGVSYKYLETWDGIFDVCKKYYDWSGGKTFFMHDSLLHYMWLSSMSNGVNLYNGNKINFDNDVVKETWNKLANASIKGYVCMDDTYATTCMMMGEVVASVESTASILYFQEQVTYKDNTKEPLDLKVMPTPYANSNNKVAIQQGVGLCATKTTPEKEKAAILFAKWITDKNNNLEFVTKAGYMPVKNDAFTQIDTFKFVDARYASLYSAIAKMKKEYKFQIVPIVDGYYNLLTAFYENSAKIFTDLNKEYENKEIDKTILDNSYNSIKNAMK